MQRVPMTPRGYKAIQDRLHQLKAVDRPANIEDIEIARAHGDLSENAEYKYAKNRQSEIAANIAYCETRLALSQVIDPAKLGGERIVFGATVEIADVDTDKEYKYQIVGEDEADVGRHLLSITSPIAKALIGKEEGDEVKVKTPKGVRHLEILSVIFTIELPTVDAAQ
jgi:transcription elongation factor GreA